MESRNFCFFFFVFLVVLCSTFISDYDDDDDVFCLKCKNSDVLPLTECLA